MRMKRVLALLLSAAMIVSSGAGSRVYAQEGSAAEEISIVDAQYETEESDLQDDEEIVVVTDEDATSEASDTEVTLETSEEDAAVAASSEDAIAVIGDTEQEDNEFDEAIASKCFGVTAEGVLTLKEGSSLPVNAVIPTSVDGVDVTTIPVGIFNKKGTVRYVKFLEDSKVTTIEPGAFSYSSSITSVELPAGVTTISDDLFRGSAMLTTVKFGSNVTSIGVNAFAGTSINSITGKKVTSIGADAFSGCTDLDFADFPVLETIGDSAFINCSSLGNGMPFAASIKSIGTCAFLGCGFTTLNLTELSSDVVIASRAFENNGSLTTVKLPNSLAVIPSRMFYSCKKLSSLTVGDTNSQTWKIETEAFKDCSSLKNITFYNIKNFEDKAFDGCSSLATIIIRYPSPQDKDFVISEEAFPEKTGVTMKGFDGKVQIYAEKRGYKFVTLYSGHTISASLNTKQVSIKASASNAVKGTEVKVVVTPVEGFVLKNIEITQESTVDIKFVEADEKTQTFSFIMPDNNVTIDITMEESGSTLSGKLSYDVSAVNGYIATKNKEKGSIVFDVAGRETDLIVKAGTTQTNPWLWNYSSNNNKIVTISNTGLMRSVGKGSAVVTATLKADDTKKISIPVQVEASAVISNIVLELTEPKRAKLYTETIEGEEVKVIEYEKSSLNNGELRFPVSIKAFTSDEPNRNLCIKSNWKSVDSTIAALEASSVSTNKNNVIIKKGAVGETMITVSVTNSGDKEAKASNTKSFIIRVIDATPRVKQDTITVNSLSEVGTNIVVTPVYGYTIAGNVLDLYTKAVRNGITTYNRVTRLTIDHVEDNKYCIYNSDGKTFTATYTGDLRLYAKGRFDETGESFYIALPDVVVTKDALDPKVTMSGKINLFYSSAAEESEAGKATLKLDIKNAEVAEYKLVSEANNKKAGSEKTDTFEYNYDIEKVSDQEFVIKRSANPMLQVNKKNVVSGWLYLRYKGYSTWVKKQIKLTTCDTAPQYVLSRTSATASTLDKDQVFYLDVVNKKNKKEVLNLAHLATGSDSGNDRGLGFTIATTDGVFLPLDADYARENGQIKLEVNGTPRAGSAVMYLQMEKWARPLQFTFKLSVSNKAPKVTLSATTATLNKAYASRSAELTLSQNQQDAVLAGIDRVVYVGSSKLAADGEKIRAKMDTSEDDLVTIFLPDKNVQAGTYKYQLVPIVRYKNSGIEQNAAAVNFSVVVVDKKPTIKLKSSTFNLNAAFPGDEKVTSTFTIGNLPTGVKGHVDTDKVKLTALKDAPSFERIAAIAFDDETVSVVLKTDARAYSGKSLAYTVTGLKVQAGEDTEEIPSFNITLKLKSAEPTIKVKSVGTLNPIALDSKVTFTATISNLATTVSNVEVWEIDPARNTIYKDKEGNPTSVHFKVVQDEKNPNIAYLKVKDGQAVENGKKYSVRLAYDLHAVGVSRKTVNFTVTPKQVVPGVKVTAQDTTIYAGQADKSFTIKIAPAPLKKGETAINAKMLTPEFASDTSAAVKKAFKITSYNPETGIMTVKLVNASIIAQDKTYTLNFVTKYANQASNTTGNKFSVKVTVKK